MTARFFLYLNAVFKVICLIIPRSKMCKIVILICMLSICGAIDNLFDHKLYENVLDSELCDQQLQSMNEFECKYCFDIKKNISLNIYVFKTFTQAVSQLKMYLIMSG